MGAKEKGSSEAKKPGKSLKEKRQAKQAKKAGKK
jgi:hypothetical protein